MNAPLFDTTGWYPGWEWLAVYVIILVSVAIVSVLAHVTYYAELAIRNWLMLRRLEREGRERMQ